MEETTLASTEHAEVSGIEAVKRKMHFSGSVLKTTLAGAIVDIGLDTPGVVHISQLQREPVNRVEDVVQVGQTVTALVTRVDAEEQKISLSIRALTDRAEREALKRYAAQQSASQATTLGDLLAGKLGRKEDAGKPGGE